MKNRMRFILPRLIGLTVVVGLITLVIGMIFKLLLLGTVLTAAGTWIARRKSYNKRVAITPTYVNQRTKHLAIIPIQ